MKTNLRIIMAVMAISAACSLHAQDGAASTPAYRSYLAVTDDAELVTRVRVRPSNQADAISEIAKNECFVVWPDKSSADWWRVTLADGTFGYVPKILVKIIDNSSELPRAALKSTAPPDATYDREGHRVRD